MCVFGAAAAAAAAVVGAVGMEVIHKKRFARLFDPVRLCFCSLLAKHALARLESADLVDLVT